MPNDRNFEDGKERKSWIDKVLILFGIRDKSLEVEPKKRPAGSLTSDRRRSNVIPLWPVTTDDQNLSDSSHHNHEIHSSHGDHGCGCGHDCSGGDGCGGGGCDGS